MSQYKLTTVCALYKMKVGISYSLRSDAAMLDTAVINDARVMSKGQVTIPKNIRAILGIAPGDRVTFVAEKDSVRVVNSAV